MWVGMAFLNFSCVWKIPERCKKYRNDIMSYSTIDFDLKILY